MGGAALRCRGSRSVAGGFRGAVLARPALIELTLDAFTLGVAVIGGTALRGSPLAMGLPATKGATQVLAAGIARVGQEENPAVPAPGQAGAQERLGVQHRPQQHIILQRQGRCRAPAIPVGPELKMLRDPD